MHPVEYVKGWGDATPVVLLPGLFAGGWVWKPTRDCLIADGFSVATMADPFALLETHSTSIDALRSVLTRVLDECEIHQAVLCGKSVGALVALDAVDRCPDRIEALVISGCPGLGVADVRPGGALSRPAPGEIVDKMFFNRSAIPSDLIEKSYAILTDRSSAINIVRYLIAIRDYDVRRCLSRIHCDLLMIWGENDQIAPVEEWEHQVHLIARASLRKLPCCGHSPMIEKPTEFNAILTEFLARTVTQISHSS